jgi:hypothetical protein
MHAITPANKYVNLGHAGPRIWSGGGMIRHPCVARRVTPVKTGAGTSNGLNPDFHRG